MTPKLAWIDIETTGLDANLDVPIELGIGLTDEHGEVIDASSWLVYEESDKDFMAGVRRGMNNEFVRPMHEKSMLWRDLELGPVYTRDEVDDRVVEFLKRNNVEQGALPMTGNSIGSLDRPFTIIHFPKLNKYLSYRNVDISSFKEVCKLVNPGLYENLKPIIGSKEDASHRVLGDITASIREYKAYLREFIWVEDDEE